MSNPNINYKIFSDYRFNNISEAESFRLPIHLSSYEPTASIGNRGQMIFSQSSITTGSIKFNQGGDVWANLVAGPSTSTDNGVARFDGTSGSVLQGSLVTINDAGSILLVDGAGIRFGTDPNAQLFNTYLAFGGPITQVTGPVPATALSANDSKRLDGQIFINLPNFTATGNAAAPITLVGSSGGLLPVGLRPTVNRQVPMVVIDNGSYVPGTLYVNTSGAVQIGVGYGATPGNFSGSGQTGFQSITAVINV